MARRTPPPAGGRELVLVDGYNLIFRHPELRILARTDLERARAELVRRIAGAAVAGGALAAATQALVVFDGREAGGLRTRGAGKVRVVFSSPGETADERIQKLLENARAAPGGASAIGAFRVVSSDREVIGRAQLWGARVTSGEDFLADLGVGPAGKAPAKPRPRPAPLGDQEIAEWERIFRRRPPGNGEGDEGGSGGGPGKH